MYWVEEPAAMIRTIVLKPAIPMPWLVATTRDGRSPSVVLHRQAMFLAVRINIEIREQS